MVPDAAEIMSHQYSCQWVEWRYVVDTLVDGCILALVGGLAAAMWIFVTLLVVVLWKNRKYP